MNFRLNNGIYRVLIALMLSSGLLALSVHAASGTVSISRNVTLDSGDSYTLIANYAVSNGATQSYHWNTGSMVVSSGCWPPSEPSCTVSASGLAAGQYAVSVSVNSTNSAYPMTTLFTVNRAPTLSIVTSAVSATPGQVISYTITVNGGTGPFNIALYDSSGNRIDQAAIQSPGGSILMSFNVSSQSNQTYYAVATDLGSSAATQFKSGSSTISVSPPASSASAMLGVLAALAALVAAILYYYSGSKT